MLLRAVRTCHVPLGFFGSLFCGMPSIGAIGFVVSLENRSRKSCSLLASFRSPLFVAPTSERFSCRMSISLAAFSLFLKDLLARLSDFLYSRTALLAVTDQNSSSSTAAEAVIRTIRIASVNFIVLLLVISKCVEQ